MRGFARQTVDGAMWLGGYVRQAYRARTPKPE